MILRRKNIILLLRVRENDIHTCQKTKIFDSFIDEMVCIVGWWADEKENCWKPKTGLVNIQLPYK